MVTLGWQVFVHVKGKNPAALWVSFSNKFCVPHLGSHPVSHAGALACWKVRLWGTLWLCLPIPTHGTGHSILDKAWWDGTAGGILSSAWVAHWWLGRGIFPSAPPHSSPRPGFTPWQLNWSGTFLLGRWPVALCHTAAAERSWSPSIF